MNNVDTFKPAVLCCLLCITLFTGAQMFQSAKLLRLLRETKEEVKNVKIDQHYFMLEPIDTQLDPPE